jgi:hypothetical protein
MKFRIMSSIAAVSGTLGLMLAFLKLVVGRRHRKNAASRPRSAADRETGDR